MGSVSPRPPGDESIEHILARLMHRSPDLVMLFGADARARYVNPACAAALERPVDGMIGLGLEQLEALGLAPRFIAALSQALAHALRHRRPQRFSAELVGGSAGPAHYEFVVAPDGPEDGPLGGVFVLGHDISALRLSQERWRRTAERLGIMASSSGAAFCEFDGDGQVLYANALAHRNLCGMAGRDLPVIGQNIRDIVGNDAGERFIARLRTALATGASHVRVDQAVTHGEARVWETTDAPELDASGRPIAVAVVAREVTSEQRLRADRARLIAALPDCLIEHDDRGICQFAHVPTGGASVFLRPAWSVPGLALTDVIGSELAALVEAARRRAQDHVETFGYRMPGGPEGRSAGEFEVRVAPREDGGTVTILRDVTTERRLEARLLLSDRLASLGRVAAGIAHEINNPLTFLSANVELALEAVDGDSALAPLLADLREGVERIRAITDDIRVLARPETQAAPTADVGEVVRSAVRMMGAAVRRQARLVVEVPPLGRVRGPMARLVQVVTNLVGNAVGAFAEPDATRHVVAISAAQVGDHVELTVRDNGSGIAAETLARVFEPFFTTKDSAGMGLGLPISQGIVTEIGGTLTLDSEVGRGTIARVTLPLATASDGAGGG